ncbi:MAG: pilus assembly protein PilM [Clostridiales bacterium]|jgi:cell division protein FtsA|nr:pilus assembly protein PilM [Clostridiales bacterium]
MPKNNEIAVLDIGSEKIRAAVAEKNNRSNIFVRGVGEAEYSGFYNGEWLDPSEIRQAVVSAVNRAEASSGRTIKKIFIGVPSEFSYSVCKEPALYFGKQKKITNDEIALLFKKGDRFQDDDLFETVNISPVYFLLTDNKRIIEPRGLMSEQLRALVSYVRCLRSFIEQFEAIFSALDIETEFVSSVWAEIMYLFEPEQRDHYILFADIGYITSSLAILRGDGILHLASFSLGGGNVTADISEVFSLPFGNAEKLKSGVDLTRSYDTGINVADNIPLKALNDIVSARLEDFADIINACIKKSTYDCPSHISLFLTGGGLSYIKGVKEFLSELTDRNIEIIAPNVPNFDKPHFSSLFGLINIAGGNTPDENDKDSGVSKKGFLNKIFKKRLEANNDD